MSPFLFIQFLICGIIFYGNGLPYQIFTKYPDMDTTDNNYYYYEDYYWTDRTPQIESEPQAKYSMYNSFGWYPVNQYEKKEPKTESQDKYSIYTNWGWFPVEKYGRKEQKQNPNDFLPSYPVSEDSYPDWPWDFDWDVMKVGETTTQKPKHLKDTIKKKFKNFTEEHNLSKNWKKFKKKSSKSVHKVKNYFKHKRVKEVLKNITNPFKYKGCKKENTTNHGCTNDEFGRNFGYLGPSVRIHPKSSHVEVIKATTIRSWTPLYLDSHFSFPRKIKVIIDTDTPEKPTKLERNVNEKSYTSNIEGDSNNSTNVLETAGEMASDLAGRVTSLWHCVLGSHRIPETNDVKFYLYTRRNIIQPELLKVDYDLINQKLKSGPGRVDVECADLSPDQIEDFERIPDEKRDIIKSNFLNLNAPTKILIHGYTGSYKDSRMAKIKDAYLTNGRYNVIQVDWELLAAPPCYIRVTHHSKFVGETIAHFLNGLYLVGLNMSLVHLVGFSLGAQVAGFTGNNLTVTPVCRITGLDPALPLFLHTQPSGHLDRLDAKFVDVIHTCGGILAMLDPLGHVDFYPNGGTRQPGCEFSNLKCSHSRAPQYFAESVVSQKKFTGQLCLTWEEYIAGDCNNTMNISYMGEPCSRRSVFGKYYLLTKSKEPFVL